MSALLVGVLAAGVVALTVGAYLLWVALSNRRRGISGLGRVVRLTCPKCQRSFDYAFVPGASLTSLRLGRSRYFACPLCGRWSVFPLTDGPGAP